MAGRSVNKISTEPFGEILGSPPIVNFLHDFPATCLLMRSLSPPTAS
jgi:hypothetical protein